MRPNTLKFCNILQNKPWNSMPWMRNVLNFSKAFLWRMAIQRWGIGFLFCIWGNVGHMFSIMSRLLMPKGNCVLPFLACGKGVAKKQNSWYILGKAACHFSDVLRLKCSEGNASSKPKTVNNQEKLHLWFIKCNSSDIWGSEDKP
jgi:hypothetical protein